MLKLSNQVRSTHDQDGAVVLDIDEGRMFRVNLIGSRMLEFLKEGCSESRIAQGISQEFGVDRTVVEADLREFLMHLEKHKLLQIRQSETDSAL